ncbi:MAG: adenylate/guanylate cyclase domain-containing protein [Alphaproteobacteria bacterium]|nr:adenylate/guanylate cyclase domain-containing protein [Alphaproteobacteria bacterium]
MSKAGNNPDAAALRMNEVAASGPVCDLDTVQQLSDWLVQQGLLGADLSDLLQGFCDRLVDVLGLPLWRGQVGMRTLHPSFQAMYFVWRRGQSVEGNQIAHSDGDSDEWRRSPFYHMLKEDMFALRVSLEDAEAVQGFPMLGEFREQGGTDYVARIMPFGDDGTMERQTGVLASWTSDRPGGFNESEIAALDRLQPRLALTIKTILAAQITKNIAATYIGGEAAERILAGKIQRGAVDVIHAVILFMDLRGFTGVSDRTPSEDLVPMLDDYLECMVEPVIEHGGQVLKYLGDGLLATFDLCDMERDSICHDALGTALMALQRTKDLNDARAAKGLPTMALDVALHLGDVFYGNVGAADRLDFTVIGPAVNEASRIEALADQLGTHLVASETFAKAATQCTPHLRSLGRHALRGLDRDQELFTLKGQSLVEA